jgi:hypothetical protein
MIRVLLPLAFVALGCAQVDGDTPTGDADPPPQHRQDERLQILEAVKGETGDILRYARNEETSYVAFRSAAGADPSDPPMECMQLIQGLRPKSVPASLGEFRDSEYFDKTTGRPGVIVTITFDEIKPGQEMHVWIRLHRSGLDGIGVKVRVVKEGQQWIGKEILSMSVS